MHDKNITSIYLVKVQKHKNVNRMERREREKSESIWPADFWNVTIFSIDPWGENTWYNTSIVIGYSMWWTVTKRIWFGCVSREFPTAGRHRESKDIEKRINREMHHKEKKESTKYNNLIHWPCWNGIVQRWQFKDMGGIS